MGKGEQDFISFVFFVIVQVNKMSFRNWDRWLVLHLFFESNGVHKMDNLLVLYNIPKIVNKYLLKNISLQVDDITWHDLIHFHHQKNICW